MTDLSPAAQAMLDAMYEVNMDFDGENATLAAAALEAVADQVVPEEPMYSFDLRWMYERDTRQSKEGCQDLLMVQARSSTFSSMHQGILMTTRTSS
ncbi:MAG: hypothetical protein EBV86_13015 [Marivivens sp.]|nr:hypothetical protein [Marivivens sp.]